MPAMAGYPGPTKMKRPGANALMGARSAPGGASTDLRTRENARKGRKRGSPGAAMLIG